MYNCNVSVLAYGVTYTMDFSPLTSILCSQISVIAVQTGLLLFNFEVSFLWQL